MTRQLSLSLTSSQQDTPASPSHQRGSEKGLMTPDISGLTSDELFRHEGPLGVFSRMFLDTSLWGSTRCSLRWKMMDTKQKRSLYRLLPSMPTTEETGPGLWPTPTAHLAKEAGYPAEGRRNTPTLSYRAGGRLNPEWVEWLMGYPINHTALNPLETPSSLK